MERQDYQVCLDAHAVILIDRSITSMASWGKRNKTNSTKSPHICLLYTTINLYSTSYEQWKEYRLARGLAPRTAASTIEHLALVHYSPYSFYIYDPTSIALFHLLLQPKVILETRQGSRRKERLTISAAV
jgi:hypothetical protein